MLILGINRDYSHRIIALKFPTSLSPFHTKRMQISHSAIYVALLHLSIPQTFGDTGPELIEKAERDLNANLWDVATIHLQDALRSENLASESKTRASLLLAECYVRSNQPQKALSILDTPNHKNAKNAMFWRAQALAKTDQKNEAIDLLWEISQDETHPYRTEAAFTASNLLLALSRSEDALTLLSNLENLPPGPSQIESQLLQVEIYLDLENLENARSILANIEDSPAELRSRKTLLTAYLHLREGSFTEAEKLFTTLNSSPVGQSRLRLKQAAIGLADSLAAQNKYPAASRSLLDFLTNHPSTANLENVFQRLINWLPPQISSPEDAALARINAWLPKPPPNAPTDPEAIITTADATKRSDLAPIDDLAAFALFIKATILHNLDSPESKTEANLLLRRLQNLAPQHPFAQSSLLLSAKWREAEAQTDEAKSLYQTIFDTATIPSIRSKSAFQLGLLAHTEDDLETAYQRFSQASDLLPSQKQSPALFNAALTHLQLIQNTDQPIETSKPIIDDPELTLETALLSSDPQKAKPALNSFLKKFPKHPRATEARIALATAALAITPPDITLAKAQIETIAAELSEQDSETQAKLALLSLQIEDGSGNYDQTIEQARALITQYPGTIEAETASLILGKALFLTGNYNDSQMALKALADTSPESPDAQAAVLIAARAAALGATAQSREEAIALFDRAISLKGPLKTVAQLEKARLNIDLNRLPAAISDLKEIYSATENKSPQKLQIGILLAEATYAHSESFTNAEETERILGLFDELEALAEANSSESYKITYLKGLTLEKLPNTENSESQSQTRALATFTSVLDEDIETKISDWEYFERSGFRALSLLETQERWLAAIAIADKIAAFKGPRAAEAQTRAEQLRLQHMIWEN